MLSYIIWNVDPRIFPELLPIRWYGLCWAIGVLLGLYFLRRGVEKDKEPLDVDRLSIYMIIAILIGARLGHILFYEPQFYWEHPEALLPFKLSPFEFTGFQGLASHGGVIGVFVGLYLFCKKYQHRHLFILDRLVIPSAILGAFIRLGNFMNSEILGIPSDVPWAVVFSRVDNVSRHPSQLYEAIFYMLIFLTLIRLRKSKYFKRKEGALFGAGLGLVFLLRFLIEFLKEDQVAFESSMALNMGQTLSIPMVLVGFCFIFKKAGKL